MFVCRHFFLQMCSYDVGAARQMIGGVPKLVKINFQCFARIPFCFFGRSEMFLLKQSHLESFEQKNINQPPINYQSTINQPSIHINTINQPPEISIFPIIFDFFLAHQAAVPGMFLPGVGCWFHGCQRPEPIQATSSLHGSHDIGNLHRKAPGDGDFHQNMGDEKPFFSPKDGD